MRLTLRTLIAYLDQTIGKDDAAALRAKINDAESIRVLIERIKRVVSQPQLMAARSTGKGLGANPNYASEYLDSTLDVEQVPEFEKLVIGSDMLLAEICEAHQVLADIAGLDTSASARLKSRLYKTANEIYKAATEEPDVFPVIEDHASGREAIGGAGQTNPPQVNKLEIDTGSSKSAKSRSRRSKWKTSPVSPPSKGVFAPPKMSMDEPLLVNDSQDGDSGVFHLSLNNTSLSQTGEVASEISTESSPSVNGSMNSMSNPALDKQTTNRPVKLIPVILVTVCLTALVSLVIASYWFPQVENGTVDVVQNESKQGSGAKGGPESNLPSKATDAKSDDASAKDVSSNFEATTNAAPEFQTGAAESKAKEDEGAPNSDSAGDVVGAIGDDDPESNELKNNEPNFQPLPPIELNSEEMVEPVKNDEVINLFKDKKYDKKADSGNGGKALQPANESSVEQGNPAVAEKSMIESGPEIKPAAKSNNGPAVAILKTNTEPTFRKTDLQNAKWIGLLENGSVHLNDTIVALSDCKPEFNIMDKVQLKMFGFSKFDFKLNEGKVLPLIVAHNGIGSLQNLSEPNTAIDVLMGGKKFQVAFPDKKSETVFLTYSVGGPASATRMIQFASLRGRAIIKFDDEVRTLSKGQVLTIDNSTSSSEISVKNFKVQPGRTTASADNLTQSAKETLMSMIHMDPIVEAGADRLLSDTKIYVRKFAVESELAIDSSLSAMEFLNDPQNRSFWRAIVFSIRDRIQTDSDFSKNLRETLLEKYDEVGEALITMLAINSDSQLESGYDKVLVDNLESPELVVRVTAIEVLFAITGKNYLFRATNSELDRKKRVNSWRKALDNGEIRFSEPVAFDLFQ